MEIPGFTLTMLQPEQHCFLLLHPQVETMFNFRKKAFGNQNVFLTKKKTPTYSWMIFLSLMFSNISSQPVRTNHIFKYNSVASNAGKI